MRFTFLQLALALTLPALVQAQCTEIFISEYCEGTGNNKGVEFYNPTGEAIDLQHTSCSAGATGRNCNGLDRPHRHHRTPRHVVLNRGQTEDVDLGGGAITGLHPRCRPMPTNWTTHAAPTYMNGDDTVWSRTNPPWWTFWQAGEDPGVAWTNDEANGYIDIGDGATVTSNHTLRRKYDVMQGVTVPPVSFNTFLEWDTLVVNTWDGLGMHSCACSPNQLEELPAVETAVFPNPSADGNLTLSATEAFQRVTVYSAAGQLLRDENMAQAVREFALTDLASGTYFVNIHLTEGRTFAHRVVIQ